MWLSSEDARIWMLMRFTMPGMQISCYRVKVLSPHFYLNGRSTPSASYFVDPEYDKVGDI